MTKPIRKRCVFCDRADQKISNEHVWPNWTLECLSDRDVRVTLLRKGVAVSQWTPKDSTGVTVNDICKPCNEGWMNDLEDLVRPFLCSIISSTRNKRTLTLEQTSQLSAWAYKIHLVFDLVNAAPQRSITRPDYDEFFKLKDTPPMAGVVIWVASYEGSMGATARGQVLPLSVTAGSTFSATIGTFSIGCFAFQVMRFDPHRLPKAGVWVPHLNYPWNRRLRLCWPILRNPEKPSDVGFIWPVTAPLNDSGMIGLRNHWANPPSPVRGLFLSF